MGFDIDCCCVGYNGETVFALPRARRALTKQFNLVDLSRRSLTYEIRLHKYSTRGFAVKIPGLDLTKVNENLYHRKTSEVKGLAKLLIFNHIQSTGLVATCEKIALDPKLAEYNARKDTEDSDYSNVFIPWGPRWFTANIIKTINRQDAAQFFGRKNRGQTHKHIFISGLQGVLTGQSNENCWCAQCKSGQPPSGDDQFVKGPLNWVTENPTRQILTGSFHPVTDNQWWTGAYKVWEPISGAKFIAATTAKTAPAERCAPKMPQKAVKAAPVSSKKLSKKTAKVVATAPKTAATFSTGPSGALPPISSFGMVHPLAGATSEAPRVGGLFSTGTTQPSFSFGQTQENVQFGRTSGLSQITQQQQPADVLSAFGSQIQPHSDVSKLLLLINHLAKDNLITPDEKSKLKNLVIRRDPTIVSVLEVFEIERDFNELADSFKRILQLKR